MVCHLSLRGVVAILVAVPSAGELLPYLAKLVLVVAGANTNKREVRYAQTTGLCRV